jgi:hypothetical protein
MVGAGVLGVNVACYGGRALSIEEEESCVVVGVDAR